MSNEQMQANTPSEPVLCKMGCGFFVSYFQQASNTRHVLLAADLRVSTAAGLADAANGLNEDRGERQQTHHGN